jgi:hypothetical protein
MKDKLKNICNYSEKQINGNSTQLMYLDMLSSEDEEYKRMIKQQNRELVVDAVLDDKVEELNIFRENSLNSVTDVSSQYNSNSTIGVISPKIMQINMTAKKFQTHKKIWDEVVDFLNKNTKNPKILQQINGLDYKLTNDYDTDMGIIISKILMCSNLIAMDGRIGPAKSVIFGKKLLPYLKNEDNHALFLKYYYSDILDDDKVIICNSNNIDQPGLLLISDTKNSNYFFNQTPNWHKQYCWFKII